MSPVSSAESISTPPICADGIPASGGVLIGQAAAPALEPGAMDWAHIVWDLHGQGGPHTLYSLADAFNQAAEFHKDNNTASG